VSSKYKYSILSGAPDLRLAGSPVIA